MIQRIIGIDICFFLSALAIVHFLFRHQLLFLQAHALVLTAQELSEPANIKLYR